MECHCERCAPLEWERAGLAGRDALPNDDGLLIAADAGRVRRTESLSTDTRVKLSGRDAYIQRLTRMTDEEPPEPDEDEKPDEEEHVGFDGEPVSGRDAYIARLSEPCDNYSRDYQRRLSHRTVVRRQR